MARESTEHVCELVPHTQPLHAAPICNCPSSTHRGWRNPAGRRPLHASIKRVFDYGAVSLHAACNDLHVMVGQGSNLSARTPLVAPQLQQLVDQFDGSRALVPA